MRNSTAWCGRTPLHRCGPAGGADRPRGLPRQRRLPYVNGHVLTVDGGMTVTVGTEL